MNEVKQEALKDRIGNEKNPVERDKMRLDLDAEPLTTGQLDAVKEREAKRELQYVKDFRQKRKQ